jgi:DNA-binding transcriptional ArsR family regulator
LTGSEQKILRALIDSDQPELELCLLTAKARVTKGQTIAAVRDLRRSGLIRTRREGRRRFASPNHRRLPALTAQERETRTILYGRAA